MGERARNFHDILRVGQQPQPDPTNFLVLKHFTVNTLLRNVLKSCSGTWKNILPQPSTIYYLLFEKVASFLCQHLSSWEHTGI